jgi:hypothetical protein
MGGRRIFSTGNERVPMRLNSKHKYGLDLGDAGFGGVLELMNENKHDITVYMDFLFEYVPKSTPGYKEALLVSQHTENLKSLAYRTIVLGRCHRLWKVKRFCSTRRQI